MNYPIQHQYKTSDFSTRPGSISSTEHNNDTAIKKDKLNKEESTFSIFNEGACGEPSKAQHLVIDFTPTEEDECEIVVKKCCDFFNYINSRKDLQQLKVKPVGIY